MRPGCPQAGQLRQKGGRGGCRPRRAARPRVPPRIGPTWPQPAHRAQRCWQARHHGLPVSSGDHAGGRACRRSSRSGSCSGTAARAQRPVGVRTLTGRRRPQPTQVSWLAGSVIRQLEHSGWPVLVAGGGLADRSAPRAGLGRGTWPRSCGRAAARRSAGCRRDDPAAARAGGRTIPVAPASHEHADQPQHRRDGCLGAGAGEQPGLILQRPGQPAALPGPGGHGVHRGGPRSRRAAPGRSRRRSRR